MDELDAIAARIVDRDRGGARGPWTLEVYPTLRCNLDCAFCDTTDRHRPAQGELAAAEWLRIVDEAAAMGARRLCVLGGGEPLIAASTPAILRRAKEHGMEGVLTTNGTLLNGGMRRLLVEIGWDEVHVSIDGADPATHDALRGQPGAFRKSISALCALRVARGTGATPRLALHTVLTNRNWFQLVEIVQLAHAMGAFRLDVDALVAYRPEQRRLALSPGEAAALPAVARAALHEAERLGLASTLARFLDGDTLRRGERLPIPGTGAGYAAAPCLKAWHHLVVQADGRTSPCCVLAGEGESVAATAVAEVWERGATLTAIRTGMLAGRPTGRCAECSENILAHERAIRARLPA